MDGYIFWRKSPWLLIGLLMLANTVSCKPFQGCNRYTESSECFVGEICNYNSKCVAAVKCVYNEDCEEAPTIFKTCISGFCQESFCLRNGQCVRGQKCSSAGKCTYPVIVTAQENENVILVPPKTHRDKLCNEKLWFKYVGEDNYPKLAHLKNGESLKYNGDLCSKKSTPCTESDKFKLDPVTGDLTIYQLQMRDEDNYYYYCVIENHWPKYELVRMEVYVTPEKHDLSIMGLRDGIEIDSTVELTCTINRIKPEAFDMYFIINEQRVNASQKGMEINLDKTLMQYIKLNYTARMEDHGAKVKCALTYLQRHKVIAQQDINILYGPTGKPTILTKQLSKYEGEEVTLTCSADSLDNGNPKSKTFLWQKIQDNDVSFPRMIEDTNQLKFKMASKYEGNYRCKCENDYGQSDASDAIVLWFLNSTSAIVPTKHDMAIKGLEDTVYSETLVELTCTVTRIKPQASEMFWKIDDRRVNARIDTIINNDGESLTQHINLHYKFLDEQNGSNLHCVLVPERANPVILTETINIISRSRKESPEGDLTKTGLFFFDSESIPLSVAMIGGFFALLILIIFLILILANRICRRLKKYSPSDTNEDIDMQVQTGPYNEAAQNHHYEEIRSSILDRNSNVVYEDTYQPNGDANSYLVPTRYKENIRQVYNNAGPAPLRVHSNNKEPGGYTTI